MFARFGQQARHAIELAEDHARSLWRPAVGPEHLLLALVAVDDAGTFERAGLRFEALRSTLLDGTPSDGPPAVAREVPAQLPLRLREVFRRAFRLSVVSGSSEVRPFHLAVALVDEPLAEISAVLRRVGVEPSDVRRELWREFERSVASTGETNVVELPARNEGRLEEAALVRALR